MPQSRGWWQWWRWWGWWQWLGKTPRGYFRSHFKISWKSLSCHPAPASFFTVVIHRTCIQGSDISPSSVDLIKPLTDIFSFGSCVLCRKNWPIRETQRTFCSPAVSWGDVACLLQWGAGVADSATLIPNGKCERSQETVFYCLCN